MRNKFSHLVLAFGMGCAGLSFADPVSDNLTRIESETLILKAREKQLEAQSNVLAKQTEITVKQHISDLIAHAAVAGHPVVRSIEGIGRTLYATVQLDDGSNVEVQTGDTLSNGMKIVSIRPNEVIAETAKKQRIRLAAAPVAPAAPVAQNPAGYPAAGQATPAMIPMLPVGAPQVRAK